MPCCFIDEGFTLYLEDRKLKLPIKLRYQFVQSPFATPKLLHGLGVPFYHESSCPLPVNGSGFQSGGRPTQQYLLNFQSLCTMLPGDGFPFPLLLRVPTHSKESILFNRCNHCREFTEAMHPSLHSLLNLLSTIAQPRAMELPGFPQRLEPASTISAANVGYVSATGFNSWEAKSWGNVAMRSQVDNATLSRRSGA